MADRERAARPAGAAVRQRVPLIHGPRQPDRLLRPHVQAVRGREAVRPVPDDHAVPDDPRPRADQPHHGPGLWALHRPRAGHGPGDQRAGRQPVLPERPPVEDDAPEAQPGLHVGPAEGRARPHRRVRGPTGRGHRPKDVVLRRRRDRVQGAGHRVLHRRHRHVCVRPEAGRRHGVPRVQPQVVPAERLAAVRPDADHAVPEAGEVVQDEAVPAGRE